MDSVTFAPIEEPSAWVILTDAGLAEYETEAEYVAAWDELVAR